MSFLFGRNFLGSRRYPIGMCFNHEGEYGEGGDGGGAGDGSFNVNLNLDNSYGTDGGADDMFTVPDTYKDKEWAKGIKSVEDLWKMNDNAQVLLGKKTLGIPDEKATDEEKAAFFKAFGVPEKPDEYEFTEDENLKKLYGEANEEVTGKFKALLHKANANKEQAKILREGYGEIVNEILQKVQSGQQEANTNFDELATKTFGERQNEVLDLAKTLISENAPEGFNDYIHTLPNEALIVMAGVLNNIKEKYIDEDDLPRGNNNTGMSEDSIRKQIQDVIASKDFQNPLSANHDTAKKEWARLSAQLDSIRRKR